MTSKKLSLALVLLASVGLTGSAVADGGGPKAKTKIQFKTLGATGSTGTLESKKSFCLKNRKVSIFRVDNFVSDKVEITYSNSKGKWETEKDLQPGPYFAKVDAEKINGVECLYAVTPEKTFN